MWHFLSKLTFCHECTEHLELSHKQCGLCEREESKQKTQNLRNITLQSLKLDKFLPLVIRVRKTKDCPKKRNIWQWKGCQISRKLYRNDWKEDLNMTRATKKETEAFLQSVQPLQTTLQIKSTPVKFPGSHYGVFVQVV